MPKRKTSRCEANKVGYGQPPKGSQFKPGRSGNPKGRPKGTRNLSSILNTVMRQKVTVTENGKTRRLSPMEVIFRRLRNDAMRSDPRALKVLLPLAERYLETIELPAEADLKTEDADVLEQYLRDTLEFRLNKGVKK